MLEIRVFDVDEGLMSRVALTYKSPQAPNPGHLIYTDAGDWCVRDVSWVPDETGIYHVNVWARFARA